jgi:5-methylthioribose kinase
VPEALDIEESLALLVWLRAHGRLAPGETPRCTNLHGGVSNRTVLVERFSGEAWVLKQALEKLRVAADWHSDPRRIHREALGLRWLARLAPPGAITPLLFDDHAQHLLAMKAVPEPHENWKTMLLDHEPDVITSVSLAGCLAPFTAALPKSARRSPSNSMTARF